MDDELRQRAVDLAYRVIARRERTVAELRADLERKGTEPEYIEEAIAELAAAGYLDDAGYARRFAEDRRSIERWGAERIERDLLNRGVPAELVADALAGVGRDDELEAAVGVLRDRVPAPPEDDRGRDRAWRMLVRRGYQPELAYEAIRLHTRDEAA
jgi:regulatory protein